MIVVALAWLASAVVFLLVGYIIQAIFGYERACQIMAGGIGLGFMGLLAAAFTYALVYKYPRFRTWKTPEP